MKIITARNMQELETAINATVGLDCSKVSMISDGNCYAVMGDTTKPSLSVTENGTYNEGPYGTVVVNVSGGTGTYQTKSVIVNGTVTPDAGYDALSSVTVAVPNGTETKSVTANGTYTPTSPNIGFSSVTVNVQPVLETKSITANGTYTPSTGNDGFGSVTVNVPQNTVAAKATTITANGTYVAQTTDSIDGYTQVVVNVSGGTGTYQAKTVTTNGVVTPDAGYDALSSVTVNVSGGGNNLAELFDGSARTKDWTDSSGVITSLKFDFGASFFGGDPSTLGAYTLSLPSCTAFETTDYGGGAITYDVCHSTIKLPNVTSITVSSAFSCCYALEHLYLNRCTALPHSLVGDDTSKQHLDVYLSDVTSVTTVEEDTFGSAYVNGYTVHVPSALLASFQTDTNWAYLVANANATLVAAS